MIIRTNVIIKPSTKKEEKKVETLEEVKPKYKVIFPVEPEEVLEEDTDKE